MTDPWFKKLEAMDRSVATRNKTPRGYRGTSIQGTPLGPGQVSPE